MSAAQSAPITAEPADAPAPVGILFNLPEQLQIPVVLRALICAEYAGYLRAQREAASSVLANIRLSSSRPS